MKGEGRETKEEACTFSKVFPSYMAELVSFSFSCRDFEAENLIVFVGIILDLMGKFRAYSELCIFSLSYVTFIQKKCYESFVFYLY